MTSQPTGRAMSSKVRVDALDTVAAVAEYDLHDMSLLHCIIRRSRGERQERALSLLSTKVLNKANALVVVLLNDPVVLNAVILWEQRGGAPEVLNTLLKCDADPGVLGLFRETLAAQGFDPLDPLVA